MAECIFTFPFTENAQILVERAKTAILKNEQATFNGNEINGNFSLPTPLGKIIGSYEIKENIAQFEISEKPFFVNCNLIEAKLKEFITLNA